MSKTIVAALADGRSTLTGALDSEDTRVMIDALRRLGLTVTHDPAGATIEVVVLEVDAATRRIRLSATGVQKLREADEVREYTERVDTTSSATFGSLGDKLRDALNPRQK